MLIYLLYVDLIDWWLVGVFSSIEKAVEKLGKDDNAQLVTATLDSVDGAYYQYVYKDKQGNVIIDPNKEEFLFCLIERPYKDINEP